jgi:hypothetical protein
MSKRAELRGGLQFSLAGIVGGDCFAEYSFYGMGNEDLMVERHKEAQYVKHGVLAWCKSLRYLLS